MSPFFLYSFTLMACILLLQFGPLACLSLGTPLFPGSHALLFHCFFPSTCHSKCTNRGVFLNPYIMKMFILLAHLIDSLGKHKILGGQRFSRRILKALLHCSLACSAAVEKPNAILHSFGWAFIFLWELLDSLLSFTAYVSQGLFLTHCAKH